MKEVITMELVECRTCGASSFTNGKCDYCRNQYEVNEDKIFYGNCIYSTAIYNNNYFISGLWCLLLDN